MMIVYYIVDRTTCKVYAIRSGKSGCPATHHWTRDGTGLTLRQLRLALRSIERNLGRSRFSDIDVLQFVTTPGPTLTPEQALGDDIEAWRRVAAEDPHLGRWQR